jgi:hypothetical protein
VPDPRLARPSPRLGRPRFRCLVCRAFVTGTELGHCPRCGWTPPDQVSISPLRPEVSRWRLPLRLALIGALALIALRVLV